MIELFGLRCVILQQHVATFHDEYLTIVTIVIDNFS